MIIPLSKLNVNEIGTIFDVKCSFKSKKKLADLGIIIGEKITLIKTNPFNTLFEIKILDSYITLAKEEANKIFINKEN